VRFDGHYPEPGSLFDCVEKAIQFGQNRKEPFLEGTILALRRRFGGRSAQTLSAAFLRHPLE